MPSIVELKNKAKSILSVMNKDFKKRMLNRKKAVKTLKQLNKSFKKRKGSKRVSNRRRKGGSKRTKRAYKSKRRRSSKRRMQPIRFAGPPSMSRGSYPSIRNFGGYMGQGASINQLGGYSRNPYIPYYNHSSRGLVNGKSFHSYDFRGPDYRQNVYNGTRGRRQSGFNFNRTFR